MKYIKKINTLANKTLKNMQRYTISNHNISFRHHGTNFYLRMLAIGPPK